MNVFQTADTSVSEYAASVCAMKRDVLDGPIGLDCSVRFAKSEVRALPDAVRVNDGGRECHMKGAVAVGLAKAQFLAIFSEEAAGLRILRR